MRKFPALKRALPIAAAFVLIACLHVLWAKWFTLEDPSQASWAYLPDLDGNEWFTRYVEAGEHWLAYTYALAGAFAAISVRNLIEARRKSRASAVEGGMAAGSVTFAGALAFGGCFLVGCCGSPMLAVWLSVFGAAFVPFAKPFIAALTTVMIVGSWFWMDRRRKQCAADGSTCC